MNIMINSRRKILKSLTLSGVIPFTGIKSFARSEVYTNGQGVLREPSKEISIVNESDVIVCGGGPAGFAAAISAAQQGARTTLIEMYGCLGGIWTTGLLSYLIDYEKKPGIMRELVARLEKSDAQHTARIYDSELMKYTLDKMCLEAGVNVRLHTRIVGAYKNNNNKLEYIVTESFSGREAWKGKIFIDTTGNGELSAFAGCNFDIGHPSTGKTQPMSLMGILTGLDEKELIANGLMREKGLVQAGAKDLFFDEIKKAGIEASYTKPTLFGIRPGLVAMMANHQYGVSSMDADQITKATLEARAEINQIIDGLRSQGGVWRNVRMVATGAQIGIREGRRIHGRYMLSKEDLINGSEFDDAVCRVDFPVDIHSLERKDGGGYGRDGIAAKPYDIPLRSLIAKDVDGLMMAGRCISGDFFAHASYRVTGNAVTMGEAAGFVGARSALNNIALHKIDYKRS